MRHNTTIHEFPVDFPSPVTADNPPALSWLQRVRLLWAERRFLYRVAVWALIASTVVAFLLPRRYESTVSIMPPDPMKESGAMLAALVGKAAPSVMAMAGNLLGMKNSGDLFVDLLRSRTVQDDIVDRFNLQKEYWAHYKQDARKTLNRRTEIVQDRKSGVISVVVSDSSPERARDIAQAYVEELNKLLAEVSTSSARRERIFIEQRLVTVKRDLEDAEQQFSAFASKNATLDIKEQAKAEVESAAMLQGQLIAAQSEVEGLEQIYTPNNFRVKAAQARIGELKRQLQKIGGSDAPLAAQGGDSSELYPSIRKLPLLGVQWADLFRRTKIQDTVYELLNQQYELARIQEAKEIATVNVIDPANVPEKRSFPPRLLIIVLVTITSVTGACAWVIGSHRVRQMNPADNRRIVFETFLEGTNRVTKRIRSLRTKLVSHNGNQSSSSE